MRHSNWIFLRSWASLAAKSGCKVKRHELPNLGFKTLSRTVNWTKRNWAGLNILHFRSLRLIISFKWFELYFSQEIMRRVLSWRPRSFQDKVNLCYRHKHQGTGRQSDRGVQKGSCYKEGQGGHSCCSKGWGVLPIPSARCQWGLRNILLKVQRLVLNWKHVFHCHIKEHCHEKQDRPSAQPVQVPYKWIKELLAEHRTKLCRVASFTQGSDTGSPDRDPSATGRGQVKVIGRALPRRHFWAPSFSLGLHGEPFFFWEAPFFFFPSGDSNMPALLVWLHVLSASSQLIIFYSVLFVWILQGYLEL